MNKVKSFAALLVLFGSLIVGGWFYPATMVVEKTDGDVVTLSTATGHLYEMFGAEDYDVGDMVSVIMFSSGTQDITDDAIIIARYSGFINA